MPTHPDYPNASSFFDRHGKERWRYRANRHAKPIPLRGLPGSTEFDENYTAAVQGKTAVVVAMPGASLPQTFNAARRLLEASIEWGQLDPETQINKGRKLKLFLERPVDPAFKLTWGDTPVVKMDFHQLDALIADVSLNHGANVAKRWLEQINALIMVALRAKWINFHPGFGLTVSPIKSDGHQEWPREIREQFETFHPVGTPARTTYELGFWLGNRRSDIVRLRNEQRVTVDFETEDGSFKVVKAFAFRQKKNERLNGGKEMFLPIMPRVDASIPSHSGFVLTTTRAGGKPYSAKALTGMMQDWTAQAGIAPGYTLHGLRKSLGNYLAELGLSARQIMEVLGHSNLAAAEVYVRKANAKKLTVSSFDAVEAAENRRRLRVVK